MKKKYTTINKKNTFVGSVLKKRLKTVTLEVNKKVKHPKYGKYLNMSLKYLVHDEKDECCIGDIVCIQQSKPYSHKKTWKIIKILIKNNIV
jgi:small subunit ribosomal protein S17